MTADDFEQAWRTLNTEMLVEVTVRRKEHPRATFQEIEQVVDQHLVQAWARLLEQVAQASAAADWRTSPPKEQLPCPQCRTPLRPSGTHPRQLQTQGGQTITLQRTYGVCPACGTGLRRYCGNGP